MSDLTKTNVPNYYKTQDGAVINTDEGSLAQYKAQREKLLREKQEKEKIKALENRVSGIEDKLDLILEKLTNG